MHGAEYECKAFKQRALATKQCARGLLRLKYISIFIWTFIILLSAEEATLSVSIRQKSATVLLSNSKMLEINHFKQQVMLTYNIYLIPQKSCARVRWPSCKKSYDRERSGTIADFQCGTCQFIWEKNVYTYGDQGPGGVSIYMEGARGLKGKPNHKGLVPGRFDLS